MAKCFQVPVRISTTLNKGMRLNKPCYDYHLDKGLFINVIKKINCKDALSLQIGWIVCSFLPFSWRLFPEEWWVFIYFLCQNSVKVTLHMWVLPSLLKTWCYIPTIIDLFLSLFPFSPCSNLSLFQELKYRSTLWIKFLNTVFKISILC